MSEEYISQLDILNLKSPRMFALNPRSIRDAAIYVHHVNVELHRAKHLLFKAITSNPAPSPHNHLCELYRICDALGRDDDGKLGQP